MKPALWVLQARLLRGRLVRWLRLLRQPKYLAGTIVGLAWTGWWLSRLSFGKGGGIRIGENGLLPLLSQDVRVAVLGAAGLALALLLTVIWIVPWGGTSLRLSETEAHLLLPAPLARRHVIHYALLKAQPGILFGSLLMTFFLGAGPLPERLVFYPVFWLLLTLWDVHMKGRSLWWGRIRELPRHRARRRVLLLLGILGLFWLSVAAGVLPALRAAGIFDPVAPETGRTLYDLAGTARQALESTWLGMVLFPFTSLLAPVIASTPAERAVGLAFPLALLVVQHEWVVRFRTRFEEDALARDRRESERGAPRSRFRRMSGRTRSSAPFTLRLSGPPEIAILWKNLIAVRRTPLRTRALWLVVALAVLLVGPLPFGNPVPYWMMQTCGLILIPYFAAFSSFQIGNDFRMDLPHAEVLRPWPLPGVRIAAAEVLAPTLSAAFRSVAAIGLVLVADAGLRITRYGLGHEVGLLPDDWGAALGVPGPLLAALFAVTAFPLLVSVAAVAAGVQNAATLLFPSWVQLGRRRRGGAATFGQRMLVFWGLSLCLLLGLIPTAMLAGGVLLGHRILGWPLAGWELPLVGILAALPLLLETAGLVLLCGHLWDRLDPSAEILGEAPG